MYLWKGEKYKTKEDVMQVQSFKDWVAELYDRHHTFTIIWMPLSHVGIPYCSPQLQV